ncbi:MAG: hypothetical protein GC178_03235 [Flavobacteriales bacterium]|nr:hypothetical protein [Flavobacteriales bacterium]
MSGVFLFCTLSASGQIDKRSLNGEKSGVVRMKDISDDELVSFKSGNHIITFNFVDITQSDTSLVFPFDRLPADTLTFSELADRTERAGGENWDEYSLKFKVKFLIDRGLVSVYSTFEKKWIKKLYRTVVYRGNYEGTDYIYTQDERLVFEVNRPFIGCPSF